MAYKKAALVVALSAATILATNEATFARSGVGPHGWLSARHFSHGVNARSILHHRRGNLGDVWPAGGFFYGPNDEAVVPPVQAIAGNGQLTTANDIPWDWVHRYPPLVAPSDRPYVPSCTAETQTFPGHNGEEQTISITRCY